MSHIFPIAEAFKTQLRELENLRQEQQKKADETAALITTLLSKMVVEQKRGVHSVALNGSNGH
jgi:hypothetical protein